MIIVDVETTVVEVMAGNAEMTADLDKTTRLRMRKKMVRKLKKKTNSRTKMRIKMEEESHVNKEEVIVIEEEVTKEAEDVGNRSTETLAEDNTMIINKMNQKQMTLVK